MIRTRFAPSPTGYLHIGGARTALYCWLEARRRGGQFILRVEDTDRERSTQAAIDAILKAMDWLGLDYDEGPIYQTQRLDRYREVAERMIAGGSAYYAYETREELEAMRLVDRRRVGGKLQPGHRVEDRLHRFVGGALAVGVLDAQQEFAAAPARLQPAVQRGARAADVQETGGTGGETGADGHRGMATTGNA